MMKAVYLPYDALEEYGALSDEQFGRLIRAGLEYARDSTEPELDGVEGYFFPGLRLKIDRDKEKYREKCEKNTENIRKRWIQEREEYERIRSNTNEYETYQQKQKQQQEQKQQHQQQQQQQQNARGDPLFKLDPKTRADLLRAGYSDSEIDRALSGIGRETEIRDIGAYLRRIMDSNRQKTVPAQNYEQRSYADTPEQREERIRDFYVRMMEEEDERKAQGDSGGK